ncbi:S24 family peptidase [Neisseria bergeri]|uniref:S24 family peptidase n=1 Tax=Neisseria bergeri TaxID=1906581 RepID=UPI0027DF737C|nr:S24 family peptidase [Neisseria bergeri]
MNKSELKEIRIENLKKFFEDKTLPTKDKSLLSQLMSGKASFGEKVSRRLEEDYGMGSYYLDSTPNSPIGSDDDYQIRFERLNIEAACGNGIENLPAEVVDYVNVSRLWAKDKFGGNLSHIKIITARGDSMAGTIDEGDVIFVDTAVTEMVEDGVYLIHVSDGLRAKRLQRTVTGGVKILSDNKRYETETVEKHDLEQLKICGKIKGAWKLEEM